MRLPKDIRKWLFAGDVVELEYPNAVDRYAPPLERENPPFQTGSSYSVQSGNGTVARCRVLRQLRADHGWTVVIAHDIQEPPRLLAKAGADYTNSPYRALWGIPGGEPEAVDELTQKRITKESHDGAVRRRQAQAFEREQKSLEARLGIARKVAEVQGVGISQHTRVIEERLRRIERLLYDERRSEDVA